MNQLRRKLTKAHYHRFHSLRELSEFTFKSRRVIWPPSPKSVLIALNKSADKVIDTIDHSRFCYEQTPLSLFDSEEITNLEWSVLLLEDRRFFIHSGIELFRASLRVLRQMITFRRVGGISTIEQQLVRTVLDDRRRNLARKVRESVVANAISYRKRKIDILRTYLDIAYMGYRLKGVDQASYLIFNAPSAELNQEQSDFLASLLVYPLPKDVILHRGELFPTVNIHEMLDRAEKINARWAKRIRTRASYASHLRAYAVKPSYKVH
jgi:hypothetical protein